MNRRPKLQMLTEAASPDEAAAVMAAVEQFLRQTAPVAAPPAPARNAWRDAALQEGVLRAPEPPAPWL